MSTENQNPGPKLAAFFRNWTSFSGFVLMASSIFAFFLLLFFDAIAQSANPYIGILTFIVAPAFFFGGLSLILLGVWRGRRASKKGPMEAPHLDIHIDFARAHDRKMLAFFIPASAGFVMLTAMGTYHTYQLTESVEFCGETCHKVMEPEYCTYKQSPHARVACTECHVGKGAEWYLRSKIAGTHQVYAVLFNKYPTPIPPPTKTLRPAQETCEQCHWPKKFVGNLDRTLNYYLPDQSNSPYSIRMTIKVGGGDPSHGPVGGIHWHMNVGNKIEFIAMDDERQNIPWIRVTDQQGAVTIYKTSSFSNDVSTMTLHQMDCMDCHNRPAHKFQSPESAVNLALSLGEIDTGLPYIKTNAMDVLCGKYTNSSEALVKIASTLIARYPNDARIRPAIEAVRKIYTNNFFPEMNVNWRSYPDNIGHKDWPGCFRCHDGHHVSSDGKRTISSSDCNACHSILAQGNPEQMTQLNSQSMKFAHPLDEYDPSFQCTDCHTGGP